MSPPADRASRRWSATSGAIIGTEPERTPDGRYVVVRGRRWRAADPELPDDVRDALQRHLGRARSAVRAATRDGDDAAVRRARDAVGLAKRGLGERGDPWWDLDLDARRDRWERALAELERADAPAETGAATRTGPVRVRS